MSIDAMKQALEALENSIHYTQTHLQDFDAAYNRHPSTENERGVITDDIEDAFAAIGALRAAINQAQEPVAWHPIETAPKDRAVLVCRRHSTIPTMAKWNAEYEWFEDFYMDHLYDLTHWLPLPPAPGASLRQWQGLTDEELNQIYAEPQTHAGQYARAIKAKLKAKNNG